MNVAAEFVVSTNSSFIFISKIWRPLFLSCDVRRSTKPNISGEGLQKECKKCISRRVLEERKFWYPNIFIVAYAKIWALFSFIVHWKSNLKPSCTASFIRALLDRNAINEKRHETPQKHWWCDISQSCLVLSHAFKILTYQNEKKNDNTGTTYKNPNYAISWRWRSRFKFCEGYIRTAFRSSSVGKFSTACRKASMNSSFLLLNQIFVCIFLLCWTAIQHVPVYSVTLSNDFLSFQILRWTCCSWRQARTTCT